MAKDAGGQARVMVIPRAAALANMRGIGVEEDAERDNTLRSLKRRTAKNKVLWNAR